MKFDDVHTAGLDHLGHRSEFRRQQCDHQPQQGVDLMLIRGQIDVRSIQLVGDQSSDRVNGLWPSDHAVIVTTLQLRAGPGAGH
jgi:hypothetical protein